MKKTLTILGSTGSIGESTLRVVRSCHEEFSVYGLSCKNNIASLEKQIEEFQPKVVAIEENSIFNTEQYTLLTKKYPGIEFLPGKDGVVHLAEHTVDVLVSAIVGAAGLRPTLAALGKAKRIALANKETLVMAGSLFMDRLKESGTELLPVDSEHNAIFSIIDTVSSHDIEKIILTASGGSLRNIEINRLHSVTPEDALNHPTWDMGNKITIDSATLMNKGLEVIEAHYLFAVPYDKIDVVIHPESVVHSMVETVDGAIFAHMGIADMALPISYALHYPEKKKNCFGKLNLKSIGSLHFLECDKKRYPALELCYAAGKSGGIVPAVLNAANEIAVGAYLVKRILFTDIVKIVEKTLARFENIKNPTIDDIFYADQEARIFSQSLL